MKFEILASGPNGRELTAMFDADVIDPPPPEKPEKNTPRLVDGEFKTGSMRRPPYELKVIKRDEYDQPCWNASELPRPDSR